MEVCVICKHPIANEVPVTLGEKGSTIINKASESRFDVIHAIPGQHVHYECRRKYCNPQQIARVTKLGKQEAQHGLAANAGKVTLRSAEKQFNFSADCFFFVWGASKVSTKEKKFRCFLC